MYSQYSEDDTILKVLHERMGDQTGALLDIGAWHATNFSNSRALIEKGWSAVLVEPSPGPLRGLVEAYGCASGRVKVIGAAVGIEPGLVWMDVTDDAVSTSSPEVYDTWKKDGGYIGGLWVPTITIEQITNQFGGFHFVSFDAEGLSVDLAKRFIDLGCRPQCMIVEHDGRLPELLEHLTKAGYRAVLVNGTNVVVSL